MSHARSGFGRVLGLVALTVVLAGCIGAYQTAPDNPVGAGGVVPAAEDKDAGRVGVVPNFVLTDYPVIAVERFQVARTEIDDEGDQRFADRMAMFFQSELVRRLRDTGLFRRVVNLSETDFPGDAGQALRLRGTITRLGRGSQAVRYLVGFGAGSTRAQAETQFVDARSGRVVLVTADRRLGSMGLFGGDSEDFLKESFDDMARDLAKFLVRLAKGDAPTAGGLAPVKSNAAYDSEGWSIVPIYDTRSLAGTWTGTAALPDNPVVPVTIVLREDGSYETVTPSSRLTGSYGITGGRARYRSTTSGRTGTLELRERDGERRLVIIIDGGGGGELKPGSK